MPIPIIKRTPEEIKKREQAEKHLSFYTDNISNAYKYYLEKVACLAMSGQDCLTLEGDRLIEHTIIEAQPNKYVIKIDNVIYVVSVILNSKAKETGICIDFLGEDGFFHVVAKNQLTKEYVKVIKSGYQIDLKTGQAVGEFSGSRQYYNAKNNNYYNHSASKMSADTLVSEIEGLIDKVENAYNQTVTAGV